MRRTQIKSLPTTFSLDLINFNFQSRRHNSPRSLSFMLMGASVVLSSPRRGNVSPRLEPFEFLDDTFFVRLHIPATMPIGNVPPRHSAARTRRGRRARTQKGISPLCCEDLFEGFSPDPNELVDKIIFSPFSASRSLLDEPMRYQRRTTFASRRWKLLHFGD